jgi:hypothetical protein
MWGSYVLIHQMERRRPVYMTFVGNLDSLVFHFFKSFFWVVSKEEAPIYKNWHVGHVPFNECAIKNPTSYKSGCSQDLCKFSLE